MSKSKVLLVDGNWNLKRNYKGKAIRIDNNKENCNGVYGFLYSLQVVINKTMPDRVITFWDGFNAGKLRYEIYKPYKAKRKEFWKSEEKAIELEYANDDKESREKFELLIQKIKVQNFLGNLFVRQYEADYIEADDLIAQYIIENPQDEIIIMCRDKDFLQLVSENVSLYHADHLKLITLKNFKEIFGHGIENQLLFRCFEGDHSDEITGVSGITRNTLIKNFPAIAHEKYTFTRLTEECYAIKEAKKNKNCKTFDKIINSKDILYRNALLMNLKKPFVTDKVIKDIKELSQLHLDNDRSIKRAMLDMTTDGYTKFLEQDRKTLDSFLIAFKRLESKEKEYAEKIKAKQA